MSKTVTGETLEPIVLKTEIDGIMTNYIIPKGVIVECNTEETYPQTTTPEEMQEARQIAGQHAVLGNADPNAQMRYFYFTYVVGQMGGFLTCQAPFMPTMFQIRAEALKIDAVAIQVGRGAGFVVNSIYEFSSEQDYQNFTKQTA